MHFCACAISANVTIIMIMVMGVIMISMSYDRAKKCRYHEKYGENTHDEMWYQRSHKQLRWRSCEGST